MGSAPKTLLNNGNATEVAWEEGLASFVTHPGVGRVLCVGDNLIGPIEGILRGMKYQVGRLGLNTTLEALPQAAATFIPDLIYVAVEKSRGFGMKALECLAQDPRTREHPLVAMIPEDTSDTVIEEAYSRSGCDFYRLGHTSVELLARTHLLVRLSKPSFGLLGENSEGSRAPSIRAANDPSHRPVDIRDSTSGLHSLEYFYHRLAGEIYRARRYGRALSVVALRCKAAENDGETSMLAATILADILRDSDVCARLRPDVFVALLPEADADARDGIHARLSHLLAQAKLRSTVGSASLDEDGIYAADELVHRALAAALSAES